MRDPSGKWMVVVDGMGGISKAALACEIADRCISEHLYDIPKKKLGDLPQLERMNFL